MKGDRGSLPIAAARVMRADTMAAMMHENLWAPWRMAYLRGLQQKMDAPAGAPRNHASAAAGQFLLAAWNAPELDERNHVVYRDDFGIVLLNRYPYANGHLLVALGEARPTLLDYEPAQRAAFWTLVEIAWEMMERTLQPQGINMGINQGSAAGAGLPEHLHAHLVPRWNGDTNFMSIVGEIRVIPDSLSEMAQQYRASTSQQVNKSTSQHG